VPRFAANLTTMFTEIDISRRFDAASEVGFRAVELLSPYSSDIRDLRGWLSAAGVEMILLNTSPGNGAAGERGLAAVPGREDDFKATFDQALTYATGLDVGMIHVMAGIAGDDGVAAADAKFVENLAWASSLARPEGIRLMIEPLNTRDVPGYLLTSSDHAARLLTELGDDNVRMQYDFYHMQVMEGDLGMTMKRRLDLIGHMQFSSVPGRNEPQYGEINLSHLFDLVDQLGYRGWMGCEYRPKTSTLEGLSWGESYGLRAPTY
jgi:hydroxypyruvate isomerase